MCFSIWQAEIWKLALCVVSFEVETNSGGKAPVMKQIF